jgi:hypothetical protein
MKVRESEPDIPIVCVCKHCGKEFGVYRRGSKYCSANCRTAGGRKLKKL